MLLEGPSCPTMILVGARVLQVVEVAVFGGDEQVGDSVLVPVDDGGACGVAGELVTGDGAFVLEAEGPVGFADVAHEVDVAAVDENVDAPVAVPIGHGELASAAGPCAFFV